MPDFLEERISGLVRMGASYGDDYAVDIVQTAGGQEYRILIHPFPVRRFDVSYLLDTEKTYNELQALYHRAHGRFAGFRVRCIDEYSTNGRISAPSAFDHPIEAVSAGVYQLRKRYGLDKAAGAAGYPVRHIKKPVAGTVLLAIGPAIVPPADWAVDSTTGLVTFSPDNTYAITGITNAAQAMITIGPHTLSAGKLLHVSGVVGMEQINGRRAIIIAAGTTAVTVAIDSTGFGTYANSGVVHTHPQPGETVTAGCEFDFPVRFNTSLPIGQDFPGYRVVDGVELVEILNP